MKKKTKIKVAKQIRIAQKTKIPKMIIIASSFININSQIACRIKKIFYTKSSIAEEQ